MTTNWEIAQMIDKARRDQGASVSSLIERSGVSRTAVYRLLKGGDVQLGTALAVAQALGLSLLTVPTRIVNYIPDVLDGTHGRTPRSNSTPPQNGPLSRATAGGGRADQSRSQTDSPLESKAQSAPLSRVNRRSMDLAERVKKLSRRL